MSDAEHNMITTQAIDENRMESAFARLICCDASSEKPRALDLFCCAGGASMGLHNAGFEVEGVDIVRQKNYPFKFHQADALDFDLSGYDFIWASPPCQRFSEQTNKAHRGNHPNLIPEIRRRLRATSKPYIIENVEGARFELINPIKLCGTMFGLPIYRHRYFESNALPFSLLPPCQHFDNPILVTGTTQKRDSAGRRLAEPSTQERRDAMQIQWMSRTELDQAIPPAYSEFLGRQILTMIERRVA